ncbi:hypothetical protein E2562_028764 [Oryza meyeriana var. granulata]|uniref:Integrase catalytic domain-containing protein n=1 Tax=Oryza meyeriana var. granulata TaxID=110450 RepID=A0A6G1E3Z3_9ORYZ|nr:hypothetical protein E2562_028764 [Oryza meyeriana var. granulata]
MGVWTYIWLDFIEALPRVGGKSVILTVVDRFSKYCHFIPLAHPYTAESVAQAFFNDIVRLHGVPQSMVSDRDPIFTSTFWRELMRLMGARLHLTTAFHPQPRSSVSSFIAALITLDSGSPNHDHLKGYPSPGVPSAEKALTAIVEVLLAELLGEVVVVLAEVTAVAVVVAVDGSSEIPTGHGEGGDDGEETRAVEWMQGTVEQRRQCRQEPFTGGLLAGTA